ncbi:MAG TPA: hypothetical protein PKI17_06760, partial [Syntrophomonas sp.]|nr:hypothetical protein [Syntrophomonas sp.]
IIKGIEHHGDNRWPGKFPQQTVDTFILKRDCVIHLKISLSILFARILFYSSVGDSSRTKGLRQEEYISCYRFTRSGILAMPKPNKGRLYHESKQLSKLTDILK